MARRPTEARTTLALDLRDISTLPRLTIDDGRVGRMAVTAADGLRGSAPPCCGLH